jgi:hypothetical protein
MTKLNRNIVCWAIGFALSIVISSSGTMLPHFP